MSLGVGDIHTDFRHILHIMHIGTCARWRHNAYILNYKAKRQNMVNMIWSTNTAPTALFFMATFSCYILYCIVLLFWFKCQLTKMGFTVVQANNQGAWNMSTGSGILFKLMALFLKQLSYGHTWPRIAPSHLGSRSGMGRDCSIRARGKRGSHPFLTKKGQNSPRIAPEH